MIVKSSSKITLDMVKKFRMEEFAQYKPSLFLLQSENFHIQTDETVFDMINFRKNDVLFEYIARIKEDRVVELIKPVEKNDPAIKLETIYDNDKEKEAFFQQLILGLGILHTSYIPGKRKLTSQEILDELKKDLSKGSNDQIVYENYCFCHKKTNDKLKLTTIVSESFYQLSIHEPEIIRYEQDWLKLRKEAKRLEPFIEDIKDYTRKNRVRNLFSLSS